MRRWGCCLWTKCSTSTGTGARDSGCTGVGIRRGMRVMMKWSFCGRGMAGRASTGRMRWCWGRTGCCMRCAGISRMCQGIWLRVRRTGVMEMIWRFGGWRTGMGSGPGSSRRAGMWRGWTWTGRTRSCFRQGSGMIMTLLSMRMGSCLDLIVTWSTTGGARGTVRCGCFMRCAAAIMDSVRGVRNGRSIMRMGCRRR